MKIILYFLVFLLLAFSWTASHAFAKEQVPLKQIYQINLQVKNKLNDVNKNFKEVKEDQKLIEIDLIKINQTLNNSKKQHSLVGLIFIIFLLISSFIIFFENRFNKECKIFSSSQWGHFFTIFRYTFKNIEYKFSLIFIVAIILIILSFFKLPNEIFYLMLGILIPIIVSLTFTDAFEKYKIENAYESINKEINNFIYRQIDSNMIIEPSTNLSPINKITQKEWSDWIKEKKLAENNESIIKYYLENLKEKKLNIAGIKRLLIRIKKASESINQFLFFRLEGNPRRFLYIKFLDKLNANINAIELYIKHVESKDTERSNDENKKLNKEQLVSSLETYYKSIQEISGKFEKMGTDYYSEID